MLFRLFSENNVIAPSCTMGLLIWILRWPLINGRGVWHAQNGWDDGNLLFPLGSFFFFSLLGTRQMEWMAFDFQFMLMGIGIFGLGMMDGMALHLLV
jgi:hypothetical protein